LALAPEASRAQRLKVTLLGTGGPRPSIERFGPATLVEADGRRFLFDAGRGVSQRLWQLSIPLGEINGVFLTHLHSDHVVGLPDLWLTGWLHSPFGRRSAPLSVWGPRGTAAMMLALRQAYAEDIRIRTEMFAYSDSAIALVGHDVGEGVVYDRDGVKVAAFAVDHGGVKPAFGYRIEFASHSVVISGDTRPSENLVRVAQGTDVLIHEVSVADPEYLRTTEVARRIMGLHSSPEGAGRVFDRVKPKVAVYTHVQVFAPPATQKALLETIVPRTRTAYSGPLELGEDLMTVVVGDAIKVSRPPADLPR